ncbi:CubicO group peptidase (beta-lactamase class C family) [Caulobacter ginsengisoli]|uniref:CubicO group peptidase (Beta-lactamase class C family) n=1 Tax=Caulobacter ginsengisoli TaxID=400775 RepID=A0ABU0IME7_9CAUL|nr:serine hydrolase [Caulobacter ginsengisoli]MDQ0463188.1 CubicO group peptidase (beta-lactamase class C family) [Caulobacter ginsengisoli]
MTLAPLPAQPAATPWPTQGWPLGDLPAGVDLAPLLDQAFGPEAAAHLGETQAVVIIQGGRLIFERYGQGRGPDDTCHSWSKAKSITQALVGLLVGDGKLDIHAPADVPEWRGAGDPRGAITLDQLLRMSSGLKFTEIYLPDQGSDVIEMLFGKGKDDVAGFAAAFPLEHAPNSFWSYSSGTSNIASRCAARALGASGADFEAFMRARLFEPLGMTSPLPRFDEAGTFIGSSFCFATPRDFARFGLLYLRDGVWEGRRLLPEGWVDYARTPTPQNPDGLDDPYGAHWWLGIAGPGSFSANGYDGQFTVVVPDLDMVIVRHGATPMDLKQNLPVWIRALADAFR